MPSQPLWAKYGQISSPSPAEQIADVAEPEQAVKVEESSKEVVVDAVKEQSPLEPAEELSLIDKIKGNPLYMAIIGGGVAILVVLALILGRRRKEVDDQLDNDLAEDFSLDIDEEPADMGDAFDESLEDAEQEANAEKSGHCI